MIPIDIRKETRILIVAPHPDDECIGAGGVLARYGVQCDVVLLTNGCAYDPMQPKEQIIAMRHAEFMREMKMAGVHQFWELGIDDETLMQHTDCLIAFNLAPYDMIFVANHVDNHPDHQAAAVCVRRALAAQQRTPAVYEYEIATPFAAPDEYLDITETIERKLDLIRCHVSQIKNVDYIGLAQSINAYRAIRESSMTYAEAYVRMDFPTRESDDLARIAAQKQRFQHLYHIACQWLRYVAEGKSIADTLQLCGCHTVALYGDTPFAYVLAHAFENTPIEVVCIIDRKGTSKQLPDFKTFRPDEDLPEIDLVIVTVAHDTEDICKTIKAKGLHAVGIEEVLKWK